MTTFLNKCTITIAPTFLLAALLSNVCSAGEYYKWVDEKGVTHFTERPVQTEGMQKITTSGAQPSTEEKVIPQEASSTPATPNTEETTTVSEAVNSEKAKYDQARCTDSQARLKTLGSGTRIRMDDGKGGFYFLDQQQIAQELQKTRNAITESCQQ